MSPCCPLLFFHIHNLSYQTIPLGLLLYSLFLYVKLLDTEMLSVLYIFCLCFRHVMSIPSRHICVAVIDIKNVRTLTFSVVE